MLSGGLQKCNLRLVLTFQMAASSSTISPPLPIIQPPPREADRPAQTQRRSPYDPRNVTSHPVRPARNPRVATPFPASFPLIAIHPFQSSRTAPSYTRLRHPLAHVADARPYCRLLRPPRANRLRVHPAPLPGPCARRRPVVSLPGCEAAFRPHLPARVRIAAGPFLPPVRVQLFARRLVQDEMGHIPTTITGIHL